MEAERARIIEIEAEIKELKLHLDALLANEAVTRRQIGVKESLLEHHKRGLELYKKLDEQE